MRSLLGRFHRPFARGTEDQLLLLNNLGDGSTLSLDFTTGVLDPRLTFDRLSTATFINSSGLVQFANANLMTYSTPRASGSAWGTTGTVTWGSATITDPLGNATAQEVTFGTAASAIFNTAGTTVVSGITHTFSVWLRAASGTTNVRIGDANVGAVSTVTLTTTWQRFSCQYVASGTNDGGAIYSQTGTPSSTFYVWGAQVQPGSIVGELLETTGTLRRNIPRFDYDPTSIGTPRGLLIEGSANNLVTQSNGSTGVWTTGGHRTPTNNTTDLVSPDGTNNATKLVCGTAGNYASFATSISGLTGGATYTISYWIRGPVGHLPRLYAQNGTIGEVTATATTGTYNNTGWTRLTQTYTLPAATTQCLVYFLSTNIVTTGDTFYVYGFQMETGSGASSHIPTGASTGSRAYDHCYATGANFTSWFSVGAGTMVVVSDNIKNNVQNLAATISDDSTSNYVRMGFKVGGAANEYLLTTVGGPSSFQGAADSGYAPPLNTVYRMAYAWDTNNFGIVANGGAVVTDSSGTLAGAGVLTRLVVGGDFVAVPNDIYFKNGHIRSLKYWPYRLPNAQLQSLTT